MSRPTLLAVRRLVVVRTLSSGAFFVLLPFLPRWLIASDDMGAEEAGVVVGVILLMTKVGAFVAGPLTSRFGPTRPLPPLFAIAALVLGIGGTLRVSFAGWLVIALVAGTCFSNATALVKVIAASRWHGSQVYVVFGYLSVAVNVAAGVGGAVAGLAASRDFPTPLLASAALASAALASVRLTSSAPDRAPGLQQPAQLNDSDMKPEKPLMPIVIGGIAVWIAYSQVFSVLPLFSEEWVSPSTIGVAFLVGSAVLVFVQLPMTRWLSLRLDGPETAVGDSASLFLGISAALMAASVAAIPLVESLGASVLFVSVAVCAFAVSIWVPLLDGEVARRHRLRSLPTAYAIVGLVWGAAEAGGAWLGLRAVGSVGNRTTGDPTAEPFFAVLAIGIAFTAVAFIVGSRSIGGQTSRE